MQKAYKLKFSQAIFFLTVLVFLDQLFKYIIRFRGGFYICNNDLAFGIKVSDVLVILVGIAILVFVFHLVNLKKQVTNKKPFNFNIPKLFESRLSGYGTLLIASGAISNLIDRLTQGCVIDFIDLIFWPVFNLADIYISCGAILILIQAFRKERNS